jgi:predicted nucleic acid-binding protein
MILLDADVLLDVALGREPHLGPARDLLTLLEARRRSAFVAWHTLSNVYSLIRPLKGGDTARSFLSDLMGFVVVAPTDTDTFRYAVSLDLHDLEDAMQVAAAWSCGARYIATRNARDFRKSPIPAVSPVKLLKELV